MSDTQYSSYSGTQSGYSNYGNYSSDSSYPQSGYPQTNVGYSATGWSGNASTGSNYSGYGQDQYNQSTPSYNYGQQQQQQQPPPPPQQQSPTYNQGGSGNYGDHGRGGYGNQGPGRGSYNKGGRGNYHSNGGSGYDGGEEIQDTIFVSGLPEEVSEQQLSEFFGSIGVIKNDKRTGKQKIWIYKDKITGKGKGEATVTYDDPPTATSAISWFNDGGEEIQDTIFVSGLPEEVSEQQLSEFFGSIGVIKNDKRTGKQKIWIYKDKITGKGKGEATVTYDDPPTATSAISWFNGKDFQGKNITVQLAQRKAQNFGMGGGGGGGGGGGRGGGMRGGRGRGGGGGGGGGSGGSGGGSGGGGGGNMSGRDGDWKCPHPNCGNTNFSWRMSCNRCQAPRDGNAGGMESGERGSRGGHRGGMRGEGGRGGRGGRGRGGQMGGRGFGRGGGRGGGPMRGGGGGGPGGERRPRPY
ncbi:RNA-binding protein cabeza-like isoform X4 [Centruroides sculpturatus]|uniref:RNA-binding protein cabeza-like isoform X4 n=1 Tax=Centruroides sculpturatus TaxID=218467 RepID=UPI000C6EF3B7|nr:RNA-binding protein cabeza-like isoform X4 [Centruroides sculpturatus]